MREGSKENIVEFTRNLLTGSKAGILTLFQCAPEVKLPLTIPQYFSKFQQQQFMGTFTEFLIHEITNDDIELIEKYTRKQYKVDLWKKQRVGSMLHRAVNYAGCDDDNYIVKCIMGISEFQGNAATNYGARTEVIAKRLYAQHMTKKHTNSLVTDCGLLISKSNPIFRATPDATVSCSCCGTGLVEIKCPYTNSIKKDLNGYEIGKLGNYHVTLNHDGDVKLKLSSPWYTQIQCQLGVSDYPWCDFVMYTKKAPWITVERIYFNKEMYEKLTAKAMSFYDKFIMPKFNQD